MVFVWPDLAPLAGNYLALTAQTVSPSISFGEECYHERQALGRALMRLGCRNFPIAPTTS